MKKQNWLTQSTIGECDFIEKEIKFDKSLKLLNIGAERHSIELAKRGYQVAYIELYDLRLPFDSEFDVAFMLCESGFPLIEADEMVFLALRDVTKSLKPHGKFIFTSIGKSFLLAFPPDEFERSSYKLTNFRDDTLVEFEDKFGNKKKFSYDELYYECYNIKPFLELLGYKKIDMFEAKRGALSREDKLISSNTERLVIAEKGEKGHTPPFLQQIFS